MENEPKNLEAKTFQQKPCTDLDLGILQKKVENLETTLKRNTEERDTKHREVKS